MYSKDTPYLTTDEIKTATIKLYYAKENTSAKTLSEVEYNLFHSMTKETTMKFANKDFFSVRFDNYSYLEQKKKLSHRIITQFDKLNYIESVHELRSEELIRFHIEGKLVADKALLKKALVEQEKAKSILYRASSKVEEIENRIKELSEFGA